MTPAVEWLELGYDDPDYFRRQLSGYYRPAGLFQIKLDHPCPCDAHALESPLVCRNCRVTRWSCSRIEFRALIAGLPLSHSCGTRYERTAR